METFDVRLGRHLAQLRESRHLAQETLAEKARLSVDTIHGYERAKRFPSRHTMNAIARVLGIEPVLHTGFAIHDSSDESYDARSPARVELERLLRDQPDPVLRLVLALARAVVEDRKSR